MKSIPEGWPPSEEVEKRQVMPLFPLSSVILFPGCVLQLHIFEPRYRQMVGDLLDTHGRLVLGTIKEDGESAEAGEVAIHPIAGMGEIGRHENLEDGRFHIWLIGLARVRIEEVESDRLYRKVKTEVLHETDVAQEREEGLRQRLRRAILERMGPPQGDEASQVIHAMLHSKIPIGSLADLLLQRLQLPQELRLELYSELDTGRRAEAILLQHSRRPLPPTD